MADDVVCATTPSPFFAVGTSYWDFRQITDEEVRGLLRRVASRPAKPAEEGASVVALISAEALPVEDGLPSDEALFDLVGNAHFVLIGEASHGTHDFYQARARMTQRLIEEKGFCAVAVAAEADWPNSYRVNRYVRDRSDDVTAEESLRGFRRLPAWMWRNTAVLDFVDGCGNTTTGSPAASARKRASTVSTCTACTARSRKSSATWTASIPRRRSGPASATPASITTTPTATPRAWGFEAAFGAGETCERQVAARPSSNVPLGRTPIATAA